MICIEVTLNGGLLYRAGITDAALLSPMLSGTVDGDFPVSLRVAGMCDLPGDRVAHVYWCNDFQVKNGDVIGFKLIDSSDPTKPEEVVPTDSPKYLAEQTEYREFEKTFIPADSALPRTYPALKFECRVNAEAHVAASLQAHEEHILCTLDWNKWHPERCRVLVRSFGNKFQDDGETEWLRCDLSVGGQIEIRVAS